MKTVAMISLYEFPLWQRCLEAVSEYVDGFVIRVDRRGAIYKNIKWIDLISLEKLR